jgi:hypothetical protein
MGRDREDAGQRRPPEYGTGRLQMENQLAVPGDSKRSGPEIIELENDFVLSAAVLVLVLVIERDSDDRRYF